MKAFARSLVYGTVEVLTAGRGVNRAINEEQIRFPARWSRFYPSVYEPERHAFLRAHCRPGQTVLDIGGHIGLYAAIFARLVGSRGRVFSFEPTPLIREILGRTVRLNGCGAVVEVRPEAVSDGSGRTVFFDTGVSGSNANSLVKGDRSRREHTVDTVAVDDFVAARGLSVGCLKVDVEGAELRVLLGASATLRDQRPALAVEIHPDTLLHAGGSLEAVWDLLEGHQYLVFCGPNRVNRSWFLGHEHGFEVQALPEEKVNDQRRSRS